MLPSKKKSGRTLAEIDAELKALQTEREAVRATEVQGIIARIKQAIEHYGLTAEDLGLAGRRTVQRKAGRTAGATGWLVKPFDPNRLIEVIQKVIR